MALTALHLAPLLPRGSLDFMTLSVYVSVELLLLSVAFGLQGDDAFARAAVDVFRFSCNAVGEMHMLRISHNGIGRSPDWHLEKVSAVICHNKCLLQNLPSTLLFGYSAICKSYSCLLWSQIVGPKMNWDLPEEKA